MAAPKPPRRTEVVDLLATFQRALHSSEIGSRLGAEARHAAALSRILDDLVADGTVVALPGHKFRLAGKERRGRDETIEGYLTAHARGFGFVAPLGGEEDLFIPAESMMGALHGDRVRVRVVARSSRGVEGAITEIVERRSAKVSGILRRRGKSAWLEPDDTRIRGPIVLGKGVDGREGEIAIVEITQFPQSNDENPEGKVIEILGEPGEPDVEVRKILMMHGVEEPHPEAAVKEADAFGAEVAKSALEGREDLTHIPLPTIDPADARDHDDAVWAIRLDEGGYRVWVAIADVSHYVAPGTALDEAALARGCSIYLPDRAIPMLPRSLSGNLCSLVPDVIRLCLCAEIELDATGATVRSRLIEGYMRSAAKLTYDGVARALGLTNEGHRQEAAEAFKADLAILREVSNLLRARRMRRGALDLEVPEARVVVDPETRLPTSIERRARDPGVAKAYAIVEDLMLLANETVAAMLVERGVPTVFRNHAAPDPEKMARFAALCTKLGVEFEAEDAEDPKKLAAFAKKLRSHPQRGILDTLLVRSMKQAVYDVTNVGHFGLASSAYVHFTSPIRRYPDLLIHRAVRALLQQKPIPKSDEAMELLREGAVTASERERRAMKVEREVVDLYRALFMRDAIGDLYAGTVMAVVASGVFVAIDDPFVEVLVRSEGLGQDAYQPDDDGLALVGTHTGDRVSLGDTMMVLVEDSSIPRRTVTGRRASVPEREAHAPADDGGGRRNKRASKKRKETRTTEPPPSARRSTGRRPKGAPKGSKKASPKAARKAAKKGKRR
ncbi:MAG: ribonuclease R [Polyangiaceae bacterium]|nr:ribonuclease R [Polyangiaceae bacterium]